MYLKKITMKNIKCFAHLEIDFSKENNINQWVTLFGRNGLGKSTLLQAIGVALAGPSAVRELLPVAEGWVRQGEPYGEIIAELIWTEGDILTHLLGRPKTKTPYLARYIVTGENPEDLPDQLPDRYSYTVPTLAPWSGTGNPKQRGDLTKDMKRLQQTAYAEGKDGWLACGYGPFRRLSGGGQEADRILYAERVSARFITLFREDAALTNTTEWLIRLHNTAREGDNRNARALEQIKTAFSTSLFPEPANLIVNAREVRLRIGDRDSVPLHDLSDGYRSMLALGLDMLRWLVKAFPNADNPMDYPGVVLIDELDAHLHPDWQRQIGHWLRERFPAIQFIVATHSPFLAQVADVDESGLLSGEADYPEVSGNIVLEQTDDGVKPQRNIESVQDYRPDQIYQSPLFNMDSLVSPATENKLKDHNELYRKKIAGQPLSEIEEKRYEQLNLWRENLPILTTPEDRHLEKDLHYTISRNREQLAQIS